MSQDDHIDSESTVMAHRLVKLVLLAAVVTAPIFLFGEGFEAKYIGRVAASNGACIVLCVGLLQLLKRGHMAFASAILVYGLLALVGTLAWSGGEPVHVNVINFTLVAVLASALLTELHVGVVASISSALMIAIAWSRPAVMKPDGRTVDIAEARFETIAQFLPTFLVVIVILIWVTRGRRGAGEHQ